jgi:hypothetical protein
MILKGLMLLFAAIILSVALSLSLNNYTLLVSNHWQYGVILLLILSFIIQLLYYSKRKDKVLPQLALGSSVVKLLVCLIYLLICMIIDKRALLPLAVHFIGHFILFTVAEIRYLSLLTKTKSAQR